MKTLTPSLLNTHKDQVETNLTSFFNLTKKNLPPQLHQANTLIENIHKLTLNGGKRLRPNLVFIGQQLTASKLKPSTLQIATAIELIHTYLLIHDDIMDQAEFRHNKPTIHLTYSKQTLNSANPQNQQYGQNIAILAGDLTNHLSFKKIISTSLPSQTKIKLLEKINNTIIQTIYGQQLDVMSPQLVRTTKKHIYNLYNLKTAQYTFECPLHLGAIISQAKSQTFKMLSDFSYYCGIAYQIKDDLKDLFDPNSDKPLGTDLKEGKHTLPIYFTLKHSSQKQKNFLKKKLGNPNLTQNEITKITNLIKQTRGDYYSHLEIQKLTTKAKEVVNQMFTHKLNTESITQLSHLIDHIASKKY